MNEEVETSVEENVEEPSGFGSVLNALLERAKSHNWVPECFKLPDIVVMLCKLKINHESTYSPNHSDVKIPVDITSGNKIVLICDKGVLEYKVSVTIAD